MSWWEWSVNKALHYPLCCMKNLYNSHTLDLSLFICYNYLFKLTCILAFKLYLLSTAAIILYHCIILFVIWEKHAKNISDNVSTSFLLTSQWTRRPAGWRCWPQCIGYRWTGGWCVGGSQGNTSLRSSVFCSSTRPWCGD